MIDITLTVGKSDVMTEVAKTASYVGQKMTGEEGAYDRIRTTDADEEELERFWEEASAEATETFKEFITNVSNGASYAVGLSLSPRFDVKLQTGMAGSLRSFFINSILSKWFVISNKKEAEVYEAAATTNMKDVVAKMYYKKKPTRMIPADLAD